ncbi:MAG: NAD(P)(+) transhydrogenase (Re/Si-specific) subunit beta [Planctomycetes bacterium]|nr:NAD(P)(+) transhydrogenase (Re/Si-specific) subunit beta [Planctomycetota bacterium]
MDNLTNVAYINVAYIVAAVLFIMGLKGLSHPRTAVRGNLTGGLAMLLAVVATLFHHGIVDFKCIVGGIAVGAVIGTILAVKIEMTAMPQLVALFNGFGGLASVIVAAAALSENIEATAPDQASTSLSFSIATMASGFIGAVTFFGSLVAFDKLQGLILKKDLRFPGQQFLNGALFLLCLGLAWWGVMTPTSFAPYWLLVLAAFGLGFFLVVAIGGADMPVVIALLNAYSGIAAAATGFVLNNSVLIIAGSLVGASGVILTMIMCKAMNRSLPNVIFGRMGEGGEVASADEVYEGKIKSTSGDEVAMLMDGVQRVLIVPGYGLAVSQAQHAVRDLADLLEEQDITVEFGIHPVAGRMPGHMNVLLAEADIAYDKLIEMDDVNTTIGQVDIAIVIGANDVVNPVARTDPQSPIAGMPIINVDKARTVVVIKRSLSPGFAGIPNPLFAADNTLMLFGDAKKAIHEIIAAVKEGL